MERTIKEQALKLGFDVVGIADASPIPADHIEYLKRWLANGYAGQMNYMHRNFDKRVNPALLLEGAKSIICVGLNCATQEAGESENGANLGKVAAYACYEDYHKFTKDKLYMLADFIAASGFNFKVCVDSAPVAERSLAARAGIGFIAKNHMLTHPVFGQQLLLGELITSLQLAVDQPLAGDCSTCGECSKACPTGALTADGLDARKCISYLTIEHKDVIGQELAQNMGNRIFGCDQCVLACRHRKNAPSGSNSNFKFYRERQLLDLNQLIKFDENEFKRRFADSPMLRTGLDRLKRNAVICLQNISEA
jgi:epoxyqueuosine reductase